jgi:hypothetical protein
MEFSSAGPAMTPLVYIQGAIEIVGGILLLVSTYTRVVALFSPATWQWLISWRISRAPSSLW